MNNHTNTTKIETHSDGVINCGFLSDPIAVHANMLRGTIAKLPYRMAEIMEGHEEAYRAIEDLIAAEEHGEGK